MSAAASGSSERADRQSPLASRRSWRPPVAGDLLVAEFANGSDQRVVPERVRRHTEVGVRGRPNRMLETESMLMQHHRHATDQPVRTTAEQQADLRDRREAAV